MKNTQETKIDKEKRDPNHRAKIYWVIGGLHERASIHSGVCRFFVLGEKANLNISRMASGCPRGHKYDSRAELDAFIGRRNMKHWIEIAECCEASEIWRVA